MQAGAKESYIRNVPPFYNIPTSPGRLISSFSVWSPRTFPTCPNTWQWPWAFFQSCGKMSSGQQNQAIAASQSPDLNPTEVVKARRPVYQSCPEILPVFETPGLNPMNLVAGVSVWELGSVSFVFISFHCVIDSKIGGLAVFVHTTAMSISASFCYLHSSYFTPVVRLLSWLPTRLMWCDFYKPRSPQCWCLAQIQKTGKKNIQPGFR